MKICIFTDAWVPMWGGGQVHILETAKELVTRYNCEIDIFVPNLVDKSKKVFPRNEDFLNGKIHLLRVGLPFEFPNFLGRTLFVLRCLIIAVTKKYDIYHSHTLTMVPILPLIKLLHSNSRTAFTLHGAAKGLLGAGIFNKFLPIDFAAKFFLYHAPIDIRFTAAKSSIDLRKANQFIFLGNAVTHAFSQKPKKGNKGHRLLFVGRLEPVKGIFDLLEAVEMLSPHDPLLKLTIVGHGPLEEKVTSFIRLHNLSKIVELKHLIKDEVVSEYQKADIFVLPSLSEGFPLTVLEAMASGLTVVATKVGDVPDIIEEGKTGFLTPAGDSKALVEAVQKAILSNRQKIGRAAQEQVRINYSWEKVTEKIYAQYSKKIS